MASGPHSFVTLSVFSPDRFQGNPLAIVAVRANALTQEQKSSISKEFGYSETVFIHDAVALGKPRRIEIYTEKGEEIPFAGHPVVGVGHYIFKYCETTTSRGPQDANREYTTTVLTKAGPVNIGFNPFRQVAACLVPQNFHVHQNKVAMAKILNVQPQIQIIPTFETCKDLKFPVVSIVKGMSFALIDLTEAPEVLAGLRAGESPEIQLDKEWDTGLKGALYYRRAQVMEQSGEPVIHAIQARMITQGIEDPGTGSACSALACFLTIGDTGSQKSSTAATEDASATEDLAKQTAKVQLDDTPKTSDKTERHIYAIKQGVEMGRACTIAVEVNIRIDGKGAKTITAVTLSGRASFFSQGVLVK